MMTTTMDKKVYRKTQRFEHNLPTPPPDPHESVEDLEKVVKSPATENPLASNCHEPSSTSDRISANTSTMTVTDAFEHLSKLYGLVDQILSLRDRNSKLFRKIRELEKVRALKKTNYDLERCLSSGQDIHVLDEDVGFAESLLGAMLSSNFELSRRASNISRASSSARRSGSLSASIEQRRVSCPVAVEVPRRNFSRISSTSSNAIEKKRSSLILAGQPKVSKWTRVKAAFKWEKAACNTSEIGGTDVDSIVKYLKLPDTTGVFNELSGPSTPVGTISSSSSVDDVFHKPHHPCSQSLKSAKRDEIPEEHDSDPSRRSQSLDGENIPMPLHLHYTNSPTIKDHFNTGKVYYRIHKTPWGKMKDIIHLRRDSLARQTCRRNDDNHSTSSLDSTDVHRLEDTRIPRVRITSDPSISTTVSKKSSQNTSDYVDLASRRLTPTLTITVPSSEELRNVSSPESITPSPPARSISESGRSDRSSQGGENAKDKNGQMSPSSSSSGILRYSLGISRSNQTTSDDHKHPKGDSLGSSPKMPRRDSKWNKVKRAFLTNATSVPTSPSKVSYFFDDGETGGSYSASASAEDLDDTLTPAAQAEIQRNYRLLHDKLGNEFYRKLAEWEKLKSSSPSLNPKESLSSIKHSRHERDVDNLRMLSEDQLTPQFRKKLDEWKRMGKAHVNTEPRSGSKRRITDWQLWRSHSKVEGKIDTPGRLSEDFIKKMEEWKRIKAATRRDDDHEIKKLEAEEENYEEDMKETLMNIINTDDREKEEDIRLSQKYKTWKGLEDEEFKPLEKIISAMEAERQTRLSKLHRVVGSAPENSHQILIHTSTGFYRFEGISRKFTRKLYEWEKSQGISPELSTFRLLDPLRYRIPCTTRRTDNNVQNEEKLRKSLSRSKSVGSIRIEAWNIRNDKSLARRPSSLSLNDMENLEARSCIVASSVPTIADEEDMSDEVALEDFDLEPEIEPEAMIVDIEDVIEETASPLTKYQPHQTPIYSVAGSETTSIAIPLGTVTARHESSPIVLVEPDDAQSVTAGAIDNVVDECFKLSEMDMTKNINKITTDTHDPSRMIITSSTDAEIDVKPQAGSNLVDEWKITQLNYSEDEDALTEVVITVACNSRQKRQGLKTRRLTDSQVGYKWQNNPNGLTNTDNKCETMKNTSSSTMSMSTLCANVIKTNDDVRNDFIDTPNCEKIKINESTLNKIIVPTSSGTITTGDSISESDLKCNNPNLREDYVNINKKSEKRDPRNMLIKTKRIVFSPLKRESKSKKLESEDCTFKFEDKKKISEIHNSIITDLKPEIKEENKVKRLSIPRSPVMARKEYKILSSKETAPSIRMMIKKYNEKLQYNENCTNFATGSTTSSGSNSPIWRSPVSERRIRDRLEKYQEEVRKAVAGPMYCKNAPLYSTGISKSATVDFVNTQVQSNDVKNSSNQILKSDTSPLIGPNNFTEKSSKKELDKNYSLTSLRALMIQKAKEDFLSGVSDYNNCNLNNNNDIHITNNNNNNIPIRKNDNAMKDTKKRRIKPVELQNLSRLDLVKSASVGMINVDLDTFGRLQLTAKDSLPRSSDQWRANGESCNNNNINNNNNNSSNNSNNNTHHQDNSNKESAGMSKFHQLASKFKKAKLRKSKEKDIGNMSTVSMLCRQSLLVDIAGTSKSCPTTPSPPYESNGNQKYMMRKSG